MAKTEKDKMTAEMRDFVLAVSKLAAALRNVECRHFERYKAIYMPKCHCVPCALLYESMQSYDDKIRAARQSARA